MSTIKNLCEVSQIAPGFAFGEIYQGNVDLQFPFIKVSDFKLGEDSWLFQSVNTVDNAILKQLRAKTYPPNTVVFPKVGGALLTKPMDPEVLQNFYVKTKPFGFWSSCKAKLDPDIRAKMKKEHFYDIISLPFVLTWHYLLLLLPVIWVIGNFEELAYGGVLIVIAMIGMYFFWYKKLPKANMYDDA